MSFATKPIKFLYFEIARLRTLYDSKPEIREAIIERYGQVVKELDGRGAKWFWAPHPMDQFIDIKKAFVKPNKPAWRIFTPEEVFGVTGFELPVLVDIKIDGMRLQIHNEDGVKIFSEDEGFNKTSKFKDPLEDIKKLPEGTILDAEGVLVADGQVLYRTSFIGYVNGKGFDEEKDKQTEFWVFDVFKWAGKDLMDEPLSVRLSYLKKVPGAGHLKTFKIGEESFICKTREEVLSAIKKVAGKKGSEGAMIKVLSSKYVRDIHNKGWCLTGGTVLLTERGFEEVEDLKEGDLIFAKDGKLHRILAVKSRLLGSTEVLYDLKGKGGFKVRLTGDHQVLGKEWCKVSDLKDLNELSRPNIILDRVEVPEILELEFLGYKKRVIMDEDFWRFIGFWVAEGSLGHGSIQQYINVFQKDQTRLIKYEEVVRRKLGCKPVYYQNGSRLEFRDPGLVKWLQIHFLDVNHDKTIPWFLASLSKEKFEAFLTGYLEGDGTYDGRRWRCSSSDAGLAGRLWSILQYRGYNIAVGKRKPRIGRGYYIITEKHSGYFETSLVKLGFQRDCLVYDIEVEDEDSFITPGLIFHNCKFKNLKEVDCLVVEIEQPKHLKGPLQGQSVEGVYNYHVAAGPYSDADGKVLLDKVPTKVREYERKVYAHLGKTFNTEIRVKVGDIIRVWSPEINKYEVKGTDLFTYGIYEPKVLEWVHERDIPDSLNVLNRLAEETSELHPREVVKQDEGGNGGHWVTVNGRYIFIGDEEQGSWEVNYDKMEELTKEFMDDQEWLVKDGDWITVNGKHILIGEGEDFEQSLHGPKISISREANTRSYSLEGGKGKADVDIYGKDFAVIDIIEVPEKERGKGYGRYIVNRVEADLRESGVKVVHVSAVASAIPFWDKLGYKTYLEKPDVSNLSPRSTSAKLELWEGKRSKDLVKPGKSEESIGITKAESNAMYCPVCGGKVSSEMC